MEDDIIINKGYLEDLGTADLLAMPIYLILIIFVARTIKAKNIAEFPHYKYLTLGIYTKIFGAISFCFVYTYYYKGGDTIGYYESTRAFCNLLMVRPEDFAHLYFTPGSAENLSLFDPHTGYPWSYLFNEERTLFLIKVLTPIVFLCFKSYLLSTIVLSTISFTGLWQMYKLFVRYYPRYQKQCAISILFIPSVVFWGSGMLKDNVTLSGICWFIVSFERVFISKVNRKKNLIAFIVSGYIVLLIKPYILMTAIPGIIVWLFYSRIHKIKSSFFRYASIPFILSISVAGGIFVLSQLGDKLGKFSLDKIMETAAITQDDLKRAEYKGNSFDIGKIDPTLQGFLSLSPAAITAGLFRPFIWEAKNILMIFSGIENFLLLGLVFLTLLKMRIFRLFKYLFDNPLLMFLFLYSVLFAFSIGLSTSNYGALIRFKIAFLPFFVATFLILFGLANEKKIK